jgi:hypothetical protein
VVRYVTEVRKPNEQRLEEYIDSNLEPLKNRLYSGAPIYDDLEEVTLTNQLSWARERLGPTHPYVRRSSTGGPAAVAKAAWRDEAQGPGGAQGPRRGGTARSRPPPTR